jgi:UDP-4-amino-4,6-dideoxy-N-acetyl-beta-L-altrosamine transaminase
VIPYGHQSINQSDIDAVLAVLQSDWLTQGPLVPRFEEAVAEKVGAEYAIAVNSATSALHIACLALELGPGDLLWTVPNTFVASANCGRYCGADVDFVDIEPGTWNISVTALREKLENAQQEGRLPKVLVPVHFAGQPTDQETIWELAREFGFRVLEDASHSIGAERRGERVGSCRWSDITVFSFHPVKIITTGEGGMALTNDRELASRMIRLRSHGITRDVERLRQPFDGPWSYEQHELGFNYRMTDIQAALGLNQLTRLDEFVTIRNDLARNYDRQLSELPLQLPVVQSESVSSFHLYVVRVLSDPGGRKRRLICGRMREAGVAVNVHYIPVHLQPYYRDLGFGPGQFPDAELHGMTALTLPLYPGLTESQQDFVIAELRKALA